MLPVLWRLACSATAIAILGSTVFTQTAPPGRDSLAGEVILRLIVVSAPEEAQRIVDRLAKGEDFAALARQESIDPSAKSGGFLGRPSRSSLRPELRRAIDGVAPGQISPVVQIPTGFAVLLVVQDTDSVAGDAVAGINPALSATGSVRYVLSFGGMNEADAALDVFPKAPDWNQDLRAICDVRRQSFSTVRASVQEFLAAATDTARASKPFDFVQTHVGLGQLHAYGGKLDQAIEQLEHAYRLAAEHAREELPYLEESLGIAYLHKSGMVNGVFYAPGDRCLFPMHPGQAYDNTADSAKAVEHFLRYLALEPDTLEVKWLLNLAYMTLGAYPEKVPPEHLLPPTAFASAEDVGRFVDVAPEAGLTSVGSAGGTIVDDFDNDGDFDVVMSSMDSCGPMSFFRNDGHGRFENGATLAGLGSQLGGLNLVQTDYNNDGCADILVLRGGWQLPQRKSLLRNNCDGTFADVTAASGLALPATSTQTAVWTDIDNDRFLDLFIGNENSSSQLFLNKGDGTFEDISRTAGVGLMAFTKGVTAGDYDNDGYPDLYVSNFGGGNHLFRNNRNRTFSQVATLAGVPGPGLGFATWFFDYDNDGLLDLFVTSYFVSVDESVRTYLRLPHSANTLKLYRNVGDGHFDDVTARVGLDKVFMPMGANFGDIDNDGFLDVYLGTGNPSYGSLLPSVLLRNKGGERFVDVTASSGTGELHKGHGVAFADLDNDGDQDLVVEIGGATPGDAHAPRLFENPGHGADWITLKLVGVKTNRAAIGARIKLTVENDGQGTRSIYRTVGSGGSFGASPLAQHVGLGKSARILDLEIWWPTSKTHQRFTSVDKNQAVEIQEFAEEYATLERRTVRLGGLKRSTR